MTLKLDKVGGINKPIYTLSSTITLTERTNKNYCNSQQIGYNYYPLIIYMQMLLIVSYSPYRIIMRKRKKIIFY